MAQKWIGLGAAISLSLVAAACGGKSQTEDAGEQGKPVVNATAAPTNPKLASLLKALPRDDREQVEEAEKTLAADLSAKLEKAKADFDAIESVGRFAAVAFGEAAAGRRDYRNTDASIDDCLDRLKKMQDPAGAPAGNMDSYRRNCRDLTLRLASIELQERFGNTAVNEAPLLKEAHKQWVAKADPKLGLFTVVQDLQTKPCEFDRSRDTAPVSPANFRNISPGMTLPQVLKAACDASDNTARLVKREMMELRETAPDGSALPPRPHISSVILCFDCGGVKGRPELRYDSLLSDALAVQFLLDGKVSSVTRLQNMVERTSIPLPQASNSGPPATHEQHVVQPVKLDVLLGALEQKLGQPSFIYNDDGITRLGWVYPDGKTALTKEHWYALPSDRMITAQLDSDPTSYVKAPSREHMQKLNPRASYCMQKHFKALNNTPVGTLLEYGAREQHANLLRKYGVKPVPADEGGRAPIYEAAGFIEKCGVIIQVIFSKAQHNNMHPIGVTWDKRSEPPVKLDRDANIYGIRMQLTDFNAVDQQVSAQAQIAASREAERKAQIEAKAAAPSKAFVP